MKASSFMSFMLYCKSEGVSLHTRTDFCIQQIFSVLFSLTCMHKGLFVWLPLNSEAKAHISIWEFWNNTRYIFLVTFFLLLGGCIQTSNLFLLEEPEGQICPHCIIICILHTVYMLFFVTACYQEKGVLLHIAEQQKTTSCHAYQMLSPLFSCTVFKHIYVPFPQSVQCSPHIHMHTSVYVFDVNHSGRIIYDNYPGPLSAHPSEALCLRDNRTKCEGTSLEIALDIKVKPFPLDYDVKKKKWPVSGKVLRRTPQISTL